MSDEKLKATVLRMTEDYLDLARKAEMKRQTRRAMAYRGVANMLGAAYQGEPVVSPVDFLAMYPEPREDHDPGAVLTPRQFACLKAGNSYDRLCRLRECRAPRAVIDNEQRLLDKYRAMAGGAREAEDRSESAGGVATAAMYPDVADGPETFVVVTYHDPDTVSGVIGPFFSTEEGQEFAARYRILSDPKPGPWNYRVEVVPVTDPDVLAKSPPG